jgi:hypothetical protein
MKKNWLVLPLLGLLAVLLLGNARPSAKPHAHPEWGFFGHKRINRMAVLTLPPDMMAFFKPNIDYLSDHAVDPDMRRYASPHEGPRHFLDMDNYGPPYDALPRHWLDAMMQFTQIWVVDARGDTLRLPAAQSSALPGYKGYYLRQVLPFFYGDNPTLNRDSLAAFWAKNSLEPAFESAFFRDSFSQHGTLPWNLQQMQQRLTEAFRQRDSRRILRLCADMGHYIGDAHVPLHTTSNYNGQKTGQHGIHGFWESRIPELFADENYDYFVGKPRYIPNTTDWFWDIVLRSNTMVDSVLGMERTLRQQFPPDRQMCPDLRLGVSVLAPCREFSDAYQQALNNMVERQMRAAIHAVSSAWYSAWVDAGQPDLRRMDEPLPSDAEREEAENIRKSFQQGKILGRPEEN